MSFLHFGKKLVSLHDENIFGEKKVTIVTDFVKNRISHFSNKMTNFEC